MINIFTKSITAALSVKSAPMLMFIYLLNAMNIAKAEQFVFSYEKASGAEQQAAKTLIKDSQGLADLKQLVNREFDLSERIDVNYGAEDGPLFAPDLSVIMMPYEFVTEVTSRFDKAKYQRTGVSIEQATEDAMLHTLLHEFAHALIVNEQIPVVGKEEDAADALANVLLIEFFEDGQEIVLSAADLFDLESTDRTTLVDEDFWDEHSLDEQRYFSALCHVYGSDPEKYQYLVTEQQLGQHRAELCIEEYQILADSWLALLAPIMKGEKHDFQDGK